MPVSFLLLPKNKYNQANCLKIVGSSKKFRNKAVITVKFSFQRLSSSEMAAILPDPIDM